ncbi:MAG: universal stress protein [Ardenticatenaceae bacterium]|nr:universal stress protein [Anaerolineales bacterium]MCB8916301.1 universal stress protein [Ardenticatenaceae bacterium]
MSGIVCAVRGGPDSQPTINRAIMLAKETDLPLFLLYVVNLEFLDRTASSRTQTISKEMAQMGEFILLTAQAKAQAEGIQAQGVIRHGHVAEEIVALCHEVSAAYLVIGQPQFHKEDNVFTTALHQEFIQRIEAQTGAKVVLPQEL